MMRKKIIIGDTVSLYPPVWGGPKRIWNLYCDLLKEKFVIEYVGLDFTRKKQCQIKEIAVNFKEYLVPLPLHYYLWYPFHKLFFKDLGIDLFTCFMMPTVKKFVKIIEDSKADIVVFSHPWTVSCLKKNKRQLFIYDAHNCEYSLIKTLIETKLIKGIVCLKTKLLEREACKNSDLILACSEKEKEELIRLYNLDEKKVYIIPNGTSIRSLPTAEEKESAKMKLGVIDKKVIIFIGTYYKPNIEAVKFIVNELSFDLNEFTFLIVGTVKNYFKNKNIPANVKFFGGVSEEQLDIILKASDIAINPVVQGGGSNIKVLDYMGYGLPIVVTKWGARAIETGCRQPMIISDIDKFKDNIKKVINNHKLYDQMAFDGNKLVSEHYDWRVISGKLQNIILEMFD